MIKITKEEARWLEKNGARWHSTLFHTYSKNKHYYMTENPRLLEKLEQYRNNMTQSI